MPVSMAHKTTPLAVATTAGTTASIARKAPRRCTRPPGTDARTWSNTCLNSAPTPTSSMGMARSRSMSSERSVRHLGRLRLVGQLAPQGRIKLLWTKFALCSRRLRPLNLQLQLVELTGVTDFACSHPQRKADPDATCAFGKAVRPPDQ